MRLLAVLVVGLAAGVVLAPAASAYPAPLQTGHYVGDADRDGVHHSIEFFVDYQAKLVRNFHFGGQHLGTTALTIHTTALGETWLFAATAPGPPQRRWNGSPTGPTSVSGQVTEDPAGARHVFHYRAHKR